MASGHEYRANRPNTWLLRPLLQSEILLANLEPSTHGPTRTFRDVGFRAAIRGMADIERSQSARSDL